MEYVGVEARNGTGAPAAILRIVQSPSQIIGTESSLLAEHHSIARVSYFRRTHRSFEQCIAYKAAWDIQHSSQGDSHKEQNLRSKLVNSMHAWSMRLCRNG